MWRGAAFGLWLAGMVAWVGATALAQEAPKPEVPPGAIYLPSSPSIYSIWSPGTAYSAALHGEADFLRAVGSMYVDLQRGRYIGDQAYQIELENSKLAVKTYFERRLLNQEYRRMLNPSYARSSQAKSPGEELYEKVRKGDLPKEMNWLVLALFQQRVANNAAFFGLVRKDTSGTPVDLAEDDLGHIWLTDKIEHGSVFLASQSIPLNEEWPHLLQGPAFAEAREQFEKARDEAIAQIKKGVKKDYFHNEKVAKAWENLVLTFDDECRAKLRTAEPPKPREYAEAIGFLRALEFQVYRFVKTNFNQEAYQFTGKSLGELVDHMGARGLYFAKPKAGDEGTYQTMFIRLHDMYMKGLYEKRMPGEAQPPRPSDKT
jgi:hypothetical protein